MADPMTFRRHHFANGPERLSLSPQRNHFADRLLLRRVWDKLAIIATSEAKRNLSAEIATSRLLVCLHLPYSLADTVALSLGKGGGDRQK